MHDVLTKWNGKTRDEIRAVQGHLLHQEIKQHLLPFSAHYREQFESLGLTSHHFKTVDDLQKLPFVSKTDLLNTPEQPRRIRDFTLIPDEDVLRKRPEVIFRALTAGKAAAKRELEREYRPIFMISTTGRSADSVPFLLTRHDIDNLERAGYALCEVLGTKADYKVINMFPYAPHLGFWQVHYAMINFNTFGVSSGGGKVMGTEGNLKLMEKIRPDSIVGMPTFLYHLLKQALANGLRFENLDAIVLGGEKVPDGMRRKLAALAAELGSPNTRVMATYGFTEARMAWAECDSGTGYHLPPDLAYIEIIDPKTGEVQPDGHPGEIVFTALDGRGTALLRYRTGDVIDGGLTYEPCPGCGRTTPRLVGKIGRQSEVKELQLDKVKGTLVDFNTLEHLLDDNDHVGTWQIELRKQNDDPLDLDELILHVQNPNNMDEENLRDELSRTVKNKTGMRPNRIEFHSLEALSKRQGLGEQLKEQRLIDNRPKSGATTS